MPVFILKNGGETLTGSSGDDTITGGTGNDRILSGDGTDLIDGGDGNDQINGYPATGGAYSYWTYSGTKTIKGGNGDDFVYGADGADSISGEDGNDTIYGSLGDDTLDGGLGNDELYGDEANDSIDGGAGNDYLSGGAGNDLLNGGEGNDSLYGNAGNDTIYGGLGNDTLSKYLAAGSSYLDGGVGDDTIWGGNGNDTIIGGDGNDSWLEGYAGDDSISGGSGNDKLYGDEGNDSLDGGIGNDSIIAGDGADTLLGGDGNDTLSGGAGNDLIQAGAGDDTINKVDDTGNDTVYGGDGNDYVNFTNVSGNKLIYGESGNDSLDGGTDNDTIDGGVGDDSIDGNLGNDSLFGGEGNDSIYGDSGNDTIDGGTGNDTLFGGDGNDSLLGGDGNDRLIDQSDGQDTLFGGAGDDTLNVYTGTGNKYLDGGTGADTLYGGKGSDTVIGGYGNDYIDGNESNDSLQGGEANDTLDGGTGNDTLDGGTGNDTLYGGDGNDTYYIDTTFDYIYDSSGTDTAYVSTSFVKLPSSIENVIYTNGAQALPYWISALLPDEAAGKRFATLLGESKTFGYNFPSALPSYDTSSKDANGFTPFTSAQQTRTVDALTYIASLLDLQFNKVSDPAAKNTFTFASNIQTNSGGYASHPSSSFEGSDVFLHIYSSNTTLADGTYGALTLIHEIGHALGLKHPFDHEQAGEGGIADAPYLTGTEENAIWTVMSYEKTSAQYHIQYSPLDIAALQYLYGPSKTSRAGSDTYKVSSTEPNFVWDGAGLDVVDAGSVTQAATIYLTPGYQGFLGLTKAEKITTAGQITVNFGTVIENLIGSNFDDHLYGNEVGNKIEGGTGNDSIEGWDGDDTILGGAGNDFLTGGSGNDSIEGGDGNDTLVVTGLATNYTIRFDSSTQNYSIEAKSGSEGKDTFKTIEFLKFSDKTIALQSIDTTPPTIAISSNLTSLGIGKTATISFTFSESVSDFVLGDIAVTGGTLSNFTGSGLAYAATFSPSLNFTGTASIKVASGKFTDSAGNTNEDGSDANNKLSITVDTQAPVVTTYSPENSSTKIAVGSDIVLTFSEEIQKGIGNVVLKTSTGVTFATYDVALSSNLSVTDTTLTINPTSNLSFDTSYKVEITSGAFKDLFGNDLAAISTYSFTTGSNQLPTGNVTITGAPKQGQSLQATNNLADPDGIGVITYQWQSSTDGNIWTNQSATSSLSLTESLVDKKIRVLASYTDTLGTKESVSSSITEPVINVNDTPTGNVSIYGTLKQGIILAATNTVADSDGLGSITYQWQSSSDNLNWTTLGTGNTYTLQEAQVGKQIKVNALYTDGHGTNESVSSAPSSAVVNVNDTPTGNVVITGALKQGETLKATNSIQDPDGLGEITYQWQSSFDGVNWTNTLISAGDTFTLTEREVNRQISVIASYTDGHGTAEKLPSLATDKLSANFILGTSNSEVIQGTPFADNISGYAGNDTITGGLGSDLIDGGTGIDTVKFSGQFGSASLAHYSIQKMIDSSWSVSYIGPITAIFPPSPTDGIDTLTNVERLQFTDRSFALDLDGNAGITAKIIGAVLGKAALNNPTYVGIGLGYLDKGMSYSDLGALALTAVGATTNDAIVSTLWLNVIGSTATTLDKAPFIKMLADGMKAGDLVALAADTAFNTTNIKLTGLALTGIEYTPVV
jgi:Ca2+-binding RTX toxin-like protein/methionine-rich copper-binding protein CopC